MWVQRSQATEASVSRTALDTNKLKESSPTSPDSPLPTAVSMTAASNLRFASASSGRKQGLPLKLGIWRPPHFTLHLRLDFGALQVQGAPIQSRSLA